MKKSPPIEITELPPPGPDLRRIVRGGLLQRFGDLSAWARENKLTPPFVVMALGGKRTSAEAQRVVELAIRDAGLGHLPRRAAEPDPTKTQAAA